MARWEAKFPIEYNPRGDTIDSFAQKTKAELELIYNLLNVLRQNSATSGNLKNVESYQFHVDTSNGKIFIRNSTNTAWSVIGNVDEDYLGITAKDIGAIANDGTIGKLSAGTDKPRDAQTGDMFYSFEERRLYYYTGTGWEIFLSLNFGDLYDYEKYCVNRAEVDYSGKDKIPRLDRNSGKGNFDISGSADKILGYPVETANLKDGQVLMFDNAKQKWVNQPKDAVTQSEVSNSGGANKIVKTDDKGFAQVSISGSAAAIDGVQVTAAGIADKKVLGYNAAYKRIEPIDTISADITGNAEKLSGVSLDAENLIDGQFLVYNARQKKLISDTREYLNESDVSNNGAAGKIVRLGNDGIIHANLEGNASKIGGIEIDASGIKDGQVFAYDSASKKLKPCAKDYVTEDKISEIGEIGKIVRLGADKTIHANLEGSVAKVDAVNFNLENITDGNLLSYNAQKKSIIPVAKDTNANSLNNILVETANLKDGQVLIYDAKNKKLVPADKDFITSADISTTGEVGKLIKVAANTPLNINITGSANAIGGINVSASKPEDGDTLVFRKSKNSFRLEAKGTAGAGKSLMFTKNAETVAEYNGSQEISVEIGAAEKLSTARKIKLSGHAEGEVLFDGSSNVELNVSNVSASLSDEADYAKKAEKLSTARQISIDGLVKATPITFDGTRDIILKVTNVDRLTTARNIRITGDAEGTGKFDGSSDLTISLTVNQAKAATSAAAAVMATRANQDAKGNVIDETYATKTEMQSTQMTVVDKYLGEYAKTDEIEKSYAKSEEIEREYVKASELSAMTATLKSASADKLSEARTITLTGAMKGSVKFDGSGNVEMSIEPTAEMTITPAELAALFYF